MPYYTATIAEHRAVKVRFFWDGDDAGAIDAWQNGEVEAAEVLDSRIDSADCFDLEIDGDQATAVTDDPNKLW